MPFQRGAPKGNRNRFVHGLYGKAVMARKEAIRKRMQIVRLVLQRVTIIDRLPDALAPRNIPRPPAAKASAWRVSLQGRVERGGDGKVHFARGGLVYENTKCLPMFSRIALMCS